MILDSSAIVAELMNEPSSKAIQLKLVQAETLGVGAPTLVETLMVLRNRRGERAQADVTKWLNRLGIQTVAFEEAHWREAVTAFERFGKGRHPAALNFGDCLSYAVATVAKQPLLFIGNDFAQTDIEQA